jgi:citronellol/citronellal dehydrogenase
MGRLEGKVAVITGASRGLGQYCAFAFAREGAHVVVAARSESDSERLPGTIYETARLIEEGGGQALPVVCNVADASSVQAMAEKVLAHLGRVDIVMSNAGIQPAGQVSTMEVRHFELEWRVNVLGTFYVIRSLLPSMLEHGSGSIITISSGAAALGTSHYGITKRAIEGLTVGLSSELCDRGIAVNALKPVSSIRTPGALFRRTPEQRAAYRGLSSESYEEAAVLIAMQGPASLTGEILTDAEAIWRLGGPDSFQKFKSINPPSWSESIRRTNDHVTVQ